MYIMENPRGEWVTLKGSYAEAHLSIGKMNLGKWEMSNQISQVWKSKSVGNLTPSYSKFQSRPGPSLFISKILLPQSTILQFQGQRFFCSLLFPQIYSMTFAADVPSNYILYYWFLLRHCFLYPNSLSRYQYCYMLFVLESSRRQSWK